MLKFIKNPSEFAYSLDKCKQVK